MANVKISELPVAASVDGASSFPVVEGGVTKQVTFTGMLASPSLFASGMATFFATPSSANLRAALTDETGTGAAVFADSPTLVGPTVSSGNVTFSGTAQRITGDFSNATLASRVMFQTSTTNGNSTPALIPNGTATTAGLLAINNSDPTNASFAAVLSLSGVMQVVSGITGTGTYLPMAFLTGGSERMRIDASGNVIVGTNVFLGSSASGRLHVETGTGQQIHLRHSAASIARFWKIGPDDFNSNFTVYNENNVGLYISYGATAWTASSDERLKDILEPIQGGASKVMSLRAVIGKYKSDASNKRRPFLIAQDVQKVLPEAVNVAGDEQGTLGLAYTEVIPLLVAAIQEQQEVINDLRARVAALEA